MLARGGWDLIQRLKVNLVLSRWIWCFDSYLSAHLAHNRAISRSALPIYYTWTATNGREVYTNGNTEQGRQLAGANFQVIYATTVLYKFPDWTSLSQYSVYGNDVW